MIEDLVLLTISEADRRYALKHIQSEELAETLKEQCYCESCIERNIIIASMQVKRLTRLAKNNGERRNAWLQTLN